MTNISIATIRELLVFNPDTGELTWGEAKPYMFSDKKCPQAVCNRWNGKYSGRPALTYRDHPSSYAYGEILGRKVYAHRAILAMHLGYWPKIVDHINRDKTDNRLINLRPCGHSLNTRNSKRRDDNKSGRRGVYWDKSRNKWASEIIVNGVRTHLGRFDNLDDAIRARDDAERKWRF